MSKYSILSILILTVFIFTYGCNNKSQGSKSKTTKTAKLKTLSKNGITLTEFYSPDQFEDASLEQEFVSEADELDNNKVTVEFKAKNYEFGKQTSMEGLKNCANAPGGQHVHFIIDNQPYLALYKTKETVDTKSDGQHIVLSFLSRSYHESIKNKNAYVLTSIITGKSRYVARYAAPDINKPMLFFSRPKGEYKGSETDAVLLDFYLTNCDLSEKGYKVKAEINGTEFLLTKWAGYFMEGLPMGENTIKLTLLDEKGNVVDSPYNGTERKIKLIKE